MRPRTLRLRSPNPQTAGLPVLTASATDWPAPTRPSSPSPGDALPQLVLTSTPAGRPTSLRNFRPTVAWVECPNSGRADVRPPPPIGACTARPAVPKRGRRGGDAAGASAGRLALSAVVPRRPACAAWRAGDRLASGQRCDSLNARCVARATTSHLSRLNHPKECSNDRQTCRLRWRRPSRDPGD
jgi:hypothetical protein